MNADTLLYLIEWGVLINLCILPIVSFLLLTRPTTNIDAAAALAALRAIEGRNG